MSNMIKQANIAGHETAMSIAKQAEAQLEGRIPENAEETAKKLGVELLEVNYMVEIRPMFVENGNVLGGMVVDLEFGENGEHVGGESVDGKFTGTLAEDGTFTLLTVVAHAEGLL